MSEKNNVFLLKSGRISVCGLTATNVDHGDISITAIVIKIITVGGRSFGVLSVCISA